MRSRNQNFLCTFVCIFQEFLLFEEVSVVEREERLGKNQTLGKVDGDLYLRQK
jgi:hypothetical protein